jgi:GNAT superfamily N-acetyltransferase
MAAGLSIYPLRDGERPAAAALLARAFRDNPLNRAVIGDSDPSRRVRVNAHGMRALLPVAQTHGSALVLRLGDHLVAVLVAVPPGGYPLPPPGVLARLRCLMGQGLGVARRWNAVFEAVSARRPAQPHAYLGALGVEPERQGEGLGSALLGHWLAAVDRAGHAAWLETDTERNRMFYARAGFEEVGDLSILGVRVWLMRRAARG